MANPLYRLSQQGEELCARHEQRLICYRTVAVCHLCVDRHRCRGIVEEGPLSLDSASNAVGKTVGFVLDYSGSLVYPLVVGVAVAIVVAHQHGFVRHQETVFENVHLDEGLAEVAGATTVVLGSVLGSIQLELELDFSEALDHSVVAN